MGNGALPNGPSYRAHPRLYPFGHAAMSEMSLLSGVNRTSRLRPATSEFDPTSALRQSRLLKIPQVDADSICDALGLAISAVHFLGPPSSSFLARFANSGSAEVWRRPQAPIWTRSGTSSMDALVRL